MDVENTGVEDTDGVGTNDEPESIEEFEARVSEDGVEYDTSGAADADDAIDETGEGAVDAAPAQPALPGMEEYFRTQNEIAARQTELLERLSAAREGPSPTQAKEQTQLEAYQQLLTDRHEMARAMAHPDVALNPTDTNHVALFRNMVHNLILEEQTTAYNAKLQALEAKLQGWEQQSQQRHRAQSAESVWAKETANFAMDSDLSETLRSAVASLVQDGTDPTEAVRAVLKPFAKLIPKKSAAAPKTPRSAEAARGIAIAAVSGRGANTSQQFRQGTTSTTSIAELENRLFGLE